jgi:hypothetical protein
MIGASGASSKMLAIRRCMVRRYNTGMNPGRTLVVGLVLALGAGASAQVGGFQMPNLWYNPTLILDAAVQKDLHLSAAETAKITQTIGQEVMKLLPAMRGPMSGKAPTPEQSKEATAAYDRMQGAIRGLTPAQKSRLHELTLQSFGPKALLDPKVGAQIGFTAKQAADLRAAMAKSAMSQRSAMQSAGAGGIGFNMGGIQSAMKGIRKSSEAALDNILTPKQRLKWKTLQGKPIEFGPLGQMMGG